MSQFVVTGNEVQVYINNVLIDLLQTLRASDDYGHEAMSGVGDIHAFEFVPALARHSVSITKFTLRKEAAITAGIINENGDAALTQVPFDIEIFGKDSGNLMRKYVNCINNSGDVSVTAHRVTVMDANFMATDATGTLNVDVAQG